MLNQLVFWLRTAGTLVVVVYISLAVWICLWTLRAKRMARQLDDARITVERAEPGQIPPVAANAVDGVNLAAEPITTGVYWDRIESLSLKDGSFVVDFYCWFLWDNAAKEPGATMQVVDGEILTKTELVKDRIGGRFYALYRVTAKITKVSELACFPCDDHQLVLALEDTAYQAHQSQYVSDNSSSISSRVRLPGYRLTGLTTVVKPHAYRTKRGNPGLPDGSKATYSQFVAAVRIQRPGWGFFWKLFQGLYAAVGIAMLAFFILPTHVDPRFGLGVGAFFAAIANQYVIGALLPDSGQFSLSDWVSGLGLFTIFLSVVQSTISLHVYDNLGQAELSHKFDRWSVGLVPTLYLATNVLLVICATTWH